MLQANELYRRFRHVVQTVDIANDACMSDEGVPDELKRCVRELDERTGLAKEVLASANRRRIESTLEELEEYGDRALRACREAGALHPETKSAVIRAHDALSDLKHLLH